MKNEKDLFNAIANVGNENGVIGEEAGKKQKKAVVFRPQYVAIAASVLVVAVAVGIVAPRLGKNGSGNKPTDKTGADSQNKKSEINNPEDNIPGREDDNPGSLIDTDPNPGETALGRLTKVATEDGMETYVYQPAIGVRPIFSKLNISVNDFRTNVFSDDVRSVISDRLNSGFVLVRVKGEHENCYPVLFDREHNEYTCLRCEFSKISGIDKNQYYFQDFEIDKDTNSTRRIIIVRTNLSDFDSIWLYDYEKGTAQKIEFPEQVKKVKNVGVNIRTNGKMTVSYNNGGTQILYVYDVNEKTWKTICSGDPSTIGISGRFVTDTEVFVTLSAEGVNKSHNLLINVETDNRIRLSEDIMSVLVTENKIIEYGNICGIGLGGLDTKDVTVNIRNRETGEIIESGYVFITGEKNNNESKSRFLVRRNIETGEEEEILWGVLPQYNAFTEDGKYWIVFSEKDAKIAVIDIDSGEYIFVDTALITHNEWTSVYYYFGRCTDIGHVEMFWTGGDNDWPTEVEHEENPGNWTCWEEYLQLKQFLGFDREGRFQTEIGFFNKMMEFKNPEFFEKIMLTALEYKGEKIDNLNNATLLANAQLYSKNGTGQIFLYEANGERNKYFVDICGHYYTFPEDRALELLELILYPYQFIDVAYEDYYMPTEAIKAFEYVDLVSAIDKYGVDKYYLEIINDLSVAEKRLGYAIRTDGFENDCYLIPTTKMTFLLSPDGELVAMWTPSNSMQKVVVERFSNEEELRASLGGAEYYKLSEAGGLTLESIIKTKNTIRFEYTDANEKDYAFTYYFGVDIDDIYDKYLLGVIAYFRGCEDGNIKYDVLQKEIYWFEENRCFKMTVPWEVADDDAQIKALCHAIRG